jgi:hypothetical protein
MGKMRNCNRRHKQFMCAVHKEMGKMRNCNKRHKQFTCTVHKEMGKMRNCNIRHKQFTCTVHKEMGKISPLKLKVLPEYISSPLSTDLTTTVQTMSRHILEKPVTEHH